MKSLQLTKPYLLVAVGLPGSGKTFFARQFSDTFNAPYIDYGYYADVLGKESLREEMMDHIYGLLFRTKQTMVIEGRGSTKAERKELTEMATKNGYGILFVWVQTEPGTAEYRAVYAKASATMNQKQFDRAIDDFENLGAGEPYMVISGKHTFSSQAKTVLKKLVTERPTTTTAAASATSASKPVVSRPGPRPNPRGRLTIR
jgi:predicted kinase